MQARVSHHWKVGTTLLDLYAIEKTFDRGGLAPVYLARHKAWATNIVLKVLSPELIAILGGREKCDGELEAWVNLALHPHIVSCYYTRPIENELIVVSEYIDGGSLRDWLDRDRLYRGDRNAALKRILDIAIQSAWGLQSARERGTIHARLKPENILISGGGAEGGIAKIADFGWGNLAPVSPAYAAPEQLQNNRTSPNSDLWSWGLTVLEMFQGKRTWQTGIQAREALERYGQTPRARQDIPSMPAAVTELLHHCWQDLEHYRPPDFRFCAEKLIQVYQEKIGSTYPRQEPDPSAYRADILNNRAVALIDLGRKQEAARYWEEARRIHPNHPESTYNWGLLLWRSRQTTDEKLLQALKDSLDARDDLTPYLMGWVHLERDDCESAIASLSVLSETRGKGESANALALARARQPESKYRKIHLPGKQPAATRPKPVNAVCFSSDARYGLSGKQDGTLELWDFKTNQGHIFAGDCQGEILSIAITPDNRYIISLSRGSVGLILKLWSLMIGKCLCTFENIDRWDAPKNTLETQLAEFPEVFAPLDFPRDSSEDLGTVFWVGNSPRGEEYGSGGSVRSGGSRGSEGSTSNKNVTSQNEIFSEDGRYILSRGAIVLTLREVVTQQILYTCLHDGTSIHLGTSRRYGLSAESRPRLWDLREGKLLYQFNNLGSVSAICLLPNGRFCLAATRDGNLQLLSLSTGRILRTIKTDRPLVRAIAVSADGRYALSGGEDLQLWNVETGRCLRTFEKSETVTAVAIAPDGRYALSGGARGTTLWQVNCYSPAPSAPLRLCQRRQSVDLLSVEELYEQELARGLLAIEEENYASALECLRQARSLPGYEWEERGLFLWGSLYDRFPRMTLRRAQEILSIAPHGERIDAIAFSPSGEWVATAGNDKTVQLWHPRTGDLHQTCQNTALGSGIALDLSLDGRYLLVGGDGGSVQIWEVASGRCQSRFSGNGSIARAVSFSPDGVYVLAGFANGELHLWKATGRRLLRRWQGHQTPIASVGFSPDGRYLLSCETGSARGESDWGAGRWKYWHIATGECLQDIAVEGERLQGICLSPDGHYGAVAGSRELSLWAIAVGRCLRVFAGHDDAITTVDFSADGNVLLSGSEDGTLRLWNVLSGECTFIFEGHREAIATARLSADSRYMVSASTDGDCKVWALDWELAERQTRAWDEGAKPYLEAFLWLHVPPAVTLPDAPRKEEEINPRTQPLPWSYGGILFLMAWMGMALATEIFTVGDLNAILLAFGAVAFVSGYYLSREIGNPSVQLGSLFGVGVLVAVAAVNVPISWIPLASTTLGIGSGLLSMGAISGLFFDDPISILPGLQACRRLKARLGYLPGIAILLLISWAGTKLEDAIALYWVSPRLVCGVLLAILAIVGCKQLWQSRKADKSKKSDKQKRRSKPTFSFSRLTSFLRPAALPRPSALLRGLWRGIGRGGRATLLIAAIAASGFKWSLPSSLGITPPDLCRDPAIVRAYLYRGGNPNVWVKREVLSSVGEAKRIPLLQCALVGDRFDIANLLLDRGINAEFAQMQGRVTPLHIAAEKSSRDIVSALLLQDANPNARDEYNRTPLHWVQSSTIAALLLDRGADVNAFSRDRGTPLHWAIAIDRLPLVQLFLDRGAKTDIQNDEGLTPLEFAEQQGREEIVKALQEWGSEEI
ncbi:MAG: protein kinase [Cyanobacteria bacterium SBLK]|nr:protein kinase [Cyanobacteria bacterium SBLK]